MQAARGRPRSGIKSKGRRCCCHGTCKTNDNAIFDKDVFFVSFPQPCFIHRNNQIARILSRPDEVVAHVASECQQCSKALRWIGLCKRHEPKVKSLDLITKNMYICSKHFINPHPIHGPSEDHPDPFNANLSEEKIQKLKNSKRKKPSDRSAVVVTKKIRQVKNTSKDTWAQGLQDVADTPNHSQHVTLHNNSISESLFIPAQDHDDGACSSHIVNGKIHLQSSISERLFNPAQEGSCSSQNEVNKVNEISNSISQSLLIPVQEGPSSPPNMNTTSTLTSKRLLVPAQKKQYIPENVHSNFEISNSTKESLVIEVLQEGLNSMDENSNLMSENLVIPVPDVDDEPPGAQHVVADDDIFNNANYGSLLPETNDNLKALVTKYGNFKWFTNFDGETASFLKLSKDNLPLFIIKVTENIGEVNFSYELFMFNQIFPIETAELDGLEEVEVKLKQMNKANVCKGITCEMLKKFFTQRQMLTGASVCAITGGLRSHKCHLFSDNNTACVSCTKYSYHLRHLSKKSEDGRTEPGKCTSNKSMSEKRLRKKLAASATLIAEAKRKISAYQKRVERLTKEKKELQNNNNINCDFTSIFFEDSD